MKKIKGDFIDELARTLPPESVDRAKKKAAKEIFMIRLSELRKNRGIRQEDIMAFSQSGISKLEARNDMKLSTLIEYLSEIGMGMEIKAYPKAKHKKNEEYIIVRV